MIYNLWWIHLKKIDLKQYKFIHSDYGVQQPSLAFKKILQENDIE